jgi:hypothetical protein
MSVRLLARTHGLKAHPDPHESSPHRETHLSLGRPTDFFPTKTLSGFVISFIRVIYMAHLIPCI